MFRRVTARRKVEGLIRDGIGLHERRWPAPRTEDEAAGLSHEILRWVRDSMVGMRRPYGINHVALAFACRDSSGSVVCSNALGVTASEVYWTPEGENRISGFLGDVEFVPVGRRGEIVAALLSLGDLAFAMHQPKAA
jgi:hypothetical protein